MVGSAIFVFPGTTGRLAGPSAIGAWILAGGLLVLIALCYTELALAFPRTGGPAVFPYETLGPSRTVRAFGSYLEGVGYTVGWLFGLTISALAIADYLAMVFPGAGGYMTIVAVSAISLAALVNLFGVEITSRTNLLLSAFLLTVLLTFIVNSLAHVRPGTYKPFVVSDGTSFLAAVQIALTAYGAWTAIPAAIEEVRRPTQTVPLAILLSLVIAMGLYAAVVAALHGVIPAREFVAGSVVMTAPLAAVAERIGTGWLRPLVGIGAVTAIFTTLLVGIMSASRVLFALGANGTLPYVFATTHDRTHVPWVGVVFVSIVAAGLAAVPQYFYQLLVVAAVVGTGIPYAINLLSFVGFRYYRTDVRSSFRAPGGYPLAVLAFIALAVAMIGLGIIEVIWSGGALVLLSGYFIFRWVIQGARFSPQKAPDE
jgi:APA family basic amino acid/polyamine antiporter